MSKKCGIGTCCAAFGAGLLVATIFPSKFIMFILAAALVILGCACARR